MTLIDPSANRGHAGWRVCNWPPPAPLWSQSGMRLVPFLAAALTAGLFASPVLAAPDGCLAVEIGDGGSPVVRATVTDQGPFDFVLDTAASGTTLDETTAARLGLTRDTATETAEGLGGPTDVHLYRVPSLK